MSRERPAPRSTIETWREQGADRLDRARFARIDALERRAARHDGELRRLLDARLGELIGAYAGDLKRSAAKAGGAGSSQAGSSKAGTSKAGSCKAGSDEAGSDEACSNKQASAKTGANKSAKRKLAASRAPAAAAPAPTLAELVERIVAATATREAAATFAPTAFPQLAALEEFRARWSRVRMDRQLRRSLQQAPTDAGPLNAGRLVHRALNTMHELSPDYLQQFMAYVDALAWLERLGAGAAADEPAAAAPAGRRARKRRE